ncbi:ATP-binding protein [Ilyobacter polytropus]|uniref:SMC domain protein n=1 Tax=Ilyobacter polytropus (strain ATCC 51220 / DSM 2926 / LMG 16218 / CuHBu1) TaxID=572544 RepID=E3HCD8_ILYPC|nr:ATP-binding protein [Ilyobacter polytropus]ADO84398.1 SMC domain protein [Ilyobacter polytropus DSM 2926]
MKLKKIILKNFRGYKDIEIPIEKNFNVIVGKNDVGKSTIMEAMEIFFNSNSIKADLGDYNVLASEKSMTIGCCFEVKSSDKIIIDTTNPTTLDKEFLLNNKGLLEIHKIWDCSKSKLTASSLKIYLKVFYPNSIELPLINLKNSELKKLIENSKSSIPNIDTINKTKNAELRKAYYENCLDKETELDNKLIDLNKEDGKKLWESISQNLPLYFLFQSDRQNKDSDNEVQNPLKIETKKVLSEIEEKLNEIKKEVKERVETISNETINYLKEFDKEIASDLKTILNLKAWDSLFNFNLIDNNEIPLNKRGSGVRRLILLSYFMAEAERATKNQNNNDVIYAFEEPENSQHPNYQKMLVESFINLSSTENYQILVTTHTPNIAKFAKPNELIFLDKINNNPFVVKKNKIEKIVETLGILPEVTSKTIVCVEGPNDVNFLININQNIEEFKGIIDLNKVTIMPLQGSNLKNWVDKNYLEGSNIKEIHIYDNDREDYKIKVEKINAEKKFRKGFITEKYEMENYIHPELINDHFEKIICSCKEGECLSCEKWNECDFIERVYSKTKIKSSDFKQILNGKITKNITKEHLIELGAFEEIKTWFKSIRDWA